MAGIDILQAANNLKVVDVWKDGNETGWVTPPVLYNPKVKVNGYSMAPVWSGHWTRWFDHGTVGVNTLAFWGNHGSINSGEYTLAHYLVPHEQTMYADGRIHDTTNIVFKMVPDGYACNHTGICSAGASNGNSRGMEYESLQHGVEDITTMQYIKGALVYAYDAALYGIKDWFRVAHGIVAVPWDRRTDPFAGNFDIAHSWEVVQAVRREPRIWRLWNLPQPIAKPVL